MPKRILIAEDEWLIAEDLRILVEQLGHTVVGIAASGEEAIDKTKQFEPDLLIMDVRMPGALDGIEAATEIQQHRKTPVPVIFLTGMAGLPRSAITFPHLFISKPFEPEKLADCILQLS